MNSLQMKLEIANNIQEFFENWDDFDIEGSYIGYIETLADYTDLTSDQINMIDQTFDVLYPTKDSSYGAIMVWETHDTIYVRIFVDFDTLFTYINNLRKSNDPREKRNIVIEEGSPLDEYIKRGVFDDNVGFV